MSKKEKEHFVHPFLDTTSRFPEDQLLRKHKFRIYKRGKKEVFWIKKGIIYSHKQALDQLDPNDVSDAQYIDMLSNQGFE